MHATAEFFSSESLDFNEIYNYFKLISVTAF